MFLSAFFLPFFVLPTISNYFTQLLNAIHSICRSKTKFGRTCCKNWDFDLQVNFFYVNASNQFLDHLKYLNSYISCICTVAWYFIFITPILRMDSWKIESICFSFSAFKCNCLCILVQLLQVVLSFTHLFSMAVLHKTPHYHAQVRVWWGESIHNSQNNKARSMLLSVITNWGRKQLNLYLLMEVDYIIYTAGAAEWRVIGYMMDGQATCASIPLGYSSVYLFILSPRKTLTNSRFA